MIMLRLIRMSLRNAGIHSPFAGEVYAILSREASKSRPPWGLGDG